MNLIDQLIHVSYTKIHSLIYTLKISGSFAETRSLGRNGSFPVWLYRFIKGNPGLDTYKLGHVEDIPKRIVH